MMRVRRLQVKNVSNFFLTWKTHTLHLVCVSRGAADKMNQSRCVSSRPMSVGCAGRRRPFLYQSAELQIAQSDLVISKFHVAQNPKDVVVA